MIDAMRTRLAALLNVDASTITLTPTATGIDASFASSLLSETSQVASQLESITPAALSAALGLEVGWISDPMRDLCCDEAAYGQACHECSQDDDDRDLRGPHDEVKLSLPESLVDERCRPARQKQGHKESNGPPVPNVRVRWGDSAGRMALHGHPDSLQGQERLSTHLNS